MQWFEWKIFSKPTFSPQSFIIFFKPHQYRERGSKNNFFLSSQFNFPSLLCLIYMIQNHICGDVSVACILSSKSQCCISGINVVQNEHSSAFSNGLPVQTHSRIGRICMIFPRSEFSNVFSNYLHDQLQSHIVCICRIFLQSEFSYVPSNRLPEEMHIHIGCICKI